MRKIILILLSLSLTACAGTSGLNFKKIEAGMTKQEVIAVMGQPDGFESEGDREALLYANRFVNEWQGWDKADYVVILTDGKVSKYGPRAIRQDNQQRAPILMYGL